MGTVRQGSVTIRISDKDMQSAMSRVAERSAGGAAYFLASLSERYIEQNHLEDKGRLKKSIHVSKGGALKGQGAVWRVTSLRRIAPHNNIIHGGRGAIFKHKKMYLQRRKNDSRKKNLAWAVNYVRAVPAFPFLAEPARQLREHHFAYAVQKADPLKGKTKGPSAAKVSDKALKDIQNAVNAGEIDG